LSLKLNRLKLILALDRDKAMNLDGLRSLLERQAVRLHQESIVQRFFGNFKYKGKSIFPDDRVKALNGRPLGMFFYNLRAVFLGCGLIFLIILELWTLMTSGEMIRPAVAILAVAWLVDVILTLYFHRSFIKDVGQWLQQENTNELPPLFNRYFVLDSIIVLVLLLSGKIWTMGYDAFAFLLFANIVVYTAYFPTVKSLRLITLVFLIFAVVFLFIFVAQVSAMERKPFQVLLFAAPLLGMVFVIVVSVLVISQLRAREHEITISRLGLLGTYGDKLSPPESVATPPVCKVDVAINAEEYRQQLSSVLEAICTLGEPFWYRSACLWFVENHQDRGELLLPAAWYEFPEAEEHLQGINATTGLLRTEKLILMHSVKCVEGKWRASTDDFRYDLDAPAAFIPLFRNNARVGVLALYGQENGSPLQRQDEAFLTSLGSIISNALEQWESLYQTQPQAQMDELFKCEKLQQVFESTVVIMREYLGAAGCMVIFRPDPDKNEMRIEAKIGMSDSIYNTNTYEVGKGLTGKSAETGQAIRIDDVPTHRNYFDRALLNGLEKAHRQEHGQPIKSWMAIPIGTKRNYGVIKVINRRVRSAWFSKQDELLGLSLALRLQVIIEKFLFIEKMKKAVDEAKANSTKAQRQSEQRQEDLMVTMHQLQGPLASMLGSISYLKSKVLRRDVLRLLPWSVAKTVEEQLPNLEDFVSDSIALSYGTFTTFGLELGRKASFGVHSINAPEELKKLALRLKKTNARPDLTFSFYAEPGFPILRMDKKVFTSVLYSLIHNAMKYADKHSQVSLICAKDRITKEPVLKVNSVGEPILSSERDTIFEKFGRGHVVSKTGRLHSGVGLGLWVAKKLMKTIDGDLTVELPPGNPRLSVFVVHIPKTNEEKKVGPPTADGSTEGDELMVS
jgi:signal transduction histidine kinase